MAFHAMMVVRDEGDVIGQTLDHLLSWCDSLSVVDLGSVDQTWEVVQEAARRDRRVRPVLRQEAVYHRGIRAWLFERCRGCFRHGDWVCRVDADEFYHVRPPEFIAGRLARGEGRVFTAHHDFHLTRGELAAWEAGLETLADRARPIDERRRHFLYVNHPELRLWRYRRWQKWDVRLCDPAQAGLTARARIPVRHYPSRDPVQLARRVELRRQANQAGHLVGHHWAEADWHAFVIDEHKPRVRHWAPGSLLPEVRRPEVAAQGWRRAAQRWFYASPAVVVRDLVARGVPRGWAGLGPSEFVARAAGSGVIGGG